MELAARQTIRALRGRRSQLALSRRLGYSSNPVAEWEGGRRFPTAAETLRAARLVHVDVESAMTTFHPGAAAALGAGDDAGVAAWLDALRGRTPVALLAERCGVSRFVASRWLSGRTRPRLHEWLVLVEALTGRAAELVALLVDIEQVPALAERYHRLVASRRLAFEAPWTEAILRLVETDAYRAAPRTPEWMAAALGIEPEEASACVRALVEAGLVRDEGGVLRVETSLSVDTASRPEALYHLKAHWIDTARRRLRAPLEGDYFGYNVFSVSRADMERIRELHVAYFRAVRAVVASSEPAEVVGLMNVHLMAFEPEP